MVRSRWSASASLAAREPVLEAPGLAAGLDDVGAVGESVDDRLGEARVGEDLRPLAEGEVGGDDPRGALVALGDHLEDELGGAFREGEVAELIKDEELDAGVAADNALQLAPRLGLLELGGEAGEGCEAHAAALLAGADCERDREVRLAGAALAGEDDRFAVIEPGAVGEGGDRRLRDGGVVVEAEVLEPFQQGEAGVEEAPALSALGSLLYLCRQCAIPHHGSPRFTGPL